MRTGAGATHELDKPLALNHPDARDIQQMRTKAADAGRYTSKLWHDKDYPRIQILTVEGLLNGTERIDAPPQINPFAMAAREQKQHEQAEML